MLSPDLLGSVILLHSAGQSCGVELTPHKDTLVFGDLAEATLTAGVSAALPVVSSFKAVGFVFSSVW